MESSEKHDIDWYSNEYYRIVMDKFYGHLLSSITREEFDYLLKTVDDRQIQDENMTYDMLAQALDSGDNDADKQITVSYIKDFLKTYVVFQDDTYVEILKQFFGHVQNNTNSLKKEIIDNIKLLKEYSKEEANAEEDGDGEGEDGVVSTFTAQENQFVIAAKNENVGVFKVSIAGRIIEVDTHGDEVMCTLVSMLFKIYCEISQFELTYVLSDREPLKVQNE